MGGRMTTIPLPVDAATTADDAADYLVQMHREGCIDLHAHPHSPLSSVSSSAGSGATAWTWPTNSTPQTRTSNDHDHHPCGRRRLPRTWATHRRQPPALHQPDTRPMGHPLHSHDLQRCGTDYRNGTNSDPNQQKVKKAMTLYLTPGAPNGVRVSPRPRSLASSASPVGLAVADVARHGRQPASDDGNNADAKARGHYL